MRRIDPRLPFREVRTMRSDVDDSLWAERTLAAVGSGLSMLAALIACVGLYGLLSYTVAQRRAEIAIRIALGARPADIGRATLQGSAVILLAGAALGIAAAVPAARLIGKRAVRGGTHRLAGAYFGCGSDAAGRTGGRGEARLARLACGSLARSARKLSLIYILR